MCVIQNDRQTRRGFTLTDLGVVLAMGVLLLAVAVSTLGNRARHQGNRIKCSSNLRLITLSAILYAESSTRYQGRFPRTTYDPKTEKPSLYTGIRGAQAFAKDGPPADGPAANDVTAALFLLLRTTELTPFELVCPDSDTTPMPTIEGYSNFPGPQHLSYSLSNPYPTQPAVAKGWKLDTTLSPDFPFVADMNFGDNAKGGPTKVSYTSPRTEMNTANSGNHHFQGQQVAYVDGHVEWQTTPFCGAPVPGRPYRDNIYANAENVDPTTGRGGVVHGAPQNATDSVLLPTAHDGPPGNPPKVTIYPGMPLPSEVDRLPWWLILGALATVIVVVVGYARREGRKTSPTT